jgi:hypothetical protein
LISVVTSFVTAMVVFMVFSQNLLYACTMKTIPAIETNRPTKNIGSGNKNARCIAQNRRCAFPG